MDVKLCEEYKVCYSGLPCGSESKEFACTAGDQGLIPESGRSLGEGNGNLLQYSYLENSMGRGAWWAIVHGVAKNHMQLTLSFHFSSQQYSCPALCMLAENICPGLKKTFTQNPRQHAVCVCIGWPTPEFHGEGVEWSRCMLYMQWVSIAAEWLPAKKTSQWCRTVASKWASQCPGERHCFY